MDEDQDLLAKCVAAAVSELERQNADPPNYDLGWLDADDPRSAVIDGHVDLVAVVQAVLAAAAAGGNAS